MSFKTLILKRLLFSVISLFIFSSTIIITPAVAIVVKPQPVTNSGSAPIQTTPNGPPSKYYCGGPKDKVYTSIDLGCVGHGNPVLDMLFGILKFLTDGVGLVVIMSLIIAGIQFSASGGDPSAAEKAIKRIRSSVSALILFIFAYAILNYVIPGTVLK